MSCSCITASLFVALIKHSTDQTPPHEVQLEQRAVIVPLIRCVSLCGFDMRVK